MHVLVTGGAGYVGSNVVAALLGAGHRVSVVDDMSSGHQEALPPEAVLTLGRCGDPATLDRASAAGLPDGVMHMAAKCSVGESMADPRRYYAANLRDSLDMMEWMIGCGVGWIIHSSTCAVYGIPNTRTLDENVCPRPINAYGATKHAVDEALRFYRGAYALRGSSLRYFNAAGAQPDGSLGEDKIPASNLIPRVLSVGLGRHESVEIYGNDYDTVDGTGVRDYIHVMDLAAAHLAAMEALAAGAEGTTYNLGAERGSSVLQVVETARKITGHEIPVQYAPRREGDPPELVATSAKAHEELGWRAQRSDLGTILADAWRWHQRHPDGYGNRATSDSVAP